MRLIFEKSLKSYNLAWNVRIGSESIDGIIASGFKDLPGPTGLEFKSRISGLNLTSLRLLAIKSSNFNSFLIIFFESTETGQRQSIKDKWKNITKIPLEILTLEELISDLTIKIPEIKFLISDSKISSPEIKQEKAKFNEMLNKYKKLLTTSIKEEQIQIFLKEHTILVDYYSERVPKQKLGEDFITDFVLMSQLDQGVSYTFIELEKVSMPLVTQNNELTSAFQHAYKQILDWDSWLEINKDYLQRKLPGLESPRFVIIGGRSKNLEESSKKILRA